MHRRHGVSRAGRNPVLFYLRARLHRRLFAWFALTILITGLAVAVAIHAVVGDDTFGRRLERTRAFTAERFAQVWDDPRAREELAGAIAQDFDVDVTVKDEADRPLVVHGPLCRRGPRAVVPVMRAGRKLGAVDVCWERSRTRSLARVFVPLGAAVVVLWIAAGGLARRLSRPIADLAQAAEEIGQGRFASRARLRGARDDELGLLSHVMDDMAAKIEKQLEGQRALMAAVSHEIRTPLARMRLLVELAREKQGDEARETLDALDREVAGVDRLVADLLASARVDFAALHPTRLDAEAVAREALERAALPAELLQVERAHGDLGFSGDPTLVARALANLLTNAEAHGEGATALRVSSTATAITFEVEDEGAGLAPGEEARIFEPFYKGAASRSSVGLGLTLVRRIAEAHGGRAHARARAPRGTVVAIELARAPAPLPSPSRD